MKLLERSQIHPIFHILLLENKLGEHGTTTVDLPLTNDKEAIVIKPETILDTRWVKQESYFVEESLIKWKHLP